MSDTQLPRVAQLYLIIHGVVHQVVLTTRLNGLALGEKHTTGDGVDEYIHNLILK